MGSSFGKQMCCVVCGSCKEEEAEGANKETGETKPILQSLGEKSVFSDTQPPTPALKVPRAGSKGVQPLSQPRWPSADTVEENTQICPAAEPRGRAEEWEAAWNPLDFFVAPTDEEVEGEDKGFSQADKQQEKVDNTGGKIQPVARVPEPQPAGGTAQGAEPVADEEQPKEQAGPGSEGALCAGINLQEKRILKLIDTGSEAASGQVCEMGPPAGTGEVLVGRDLPFCAVQVAEKTEPCLPAEHMEGMDRAKLTDLTPKSPQMPRPACLLEAGSLLTVQSPSEVMASGVAGLCSTSDASWGSLSPQWGSLEPANQLLDFLKPEPLSSVPSAQGMGSLHRAEPAGLRELLHQSSHRVLCQLGNEGSREGDAGTVAGEAELQHKIMQQTLELPEEPVACVPVPVKQEAELPNVPPSLPGVLESSGETEAENVEA